MSFDEVKSALLAAANAYEPPFMANTFLAANMTDEDRVRQTLNDAFQKHREMKKFEEELNWERALYSAHVMMKLIEKENLANRMEPSLRGLSMKLQRDILGKNNSKIEGQMESYEEQLKESLNQSPG